MAPLFVAPLFVAPLFVAPLFVAPLFVAPLSMALGLESAYTTRPRLASRLERRWSGAVAAARIVWTVADSPSRKEWQT